MKIELNQKLEELSLKLDAASSWQDRMDQLIAIRILFQQRIESREKEERLQALERRGATSQTLSNTYQGLGFNWNTTLAVVQAAGSFSAGIGQFVPKGYDISKLVIGTVAGTGQTVSVVKGLNDEGRQGNRSLLQTGIEKINQHLEDLRRDQQKSQEGISGLFSLMKQMENEAHNATSRVNS